MKKPILAVAGILALGALPVVADEERGLYLGGGVGQFNVDIDDIDETDDAIEGYDSDDTAWRAFVGWRFNPFLAVEGAYVNLGSPDDTIGPGITAELETDGFTPYVVGTLPIGPIELYARAGYFFYDTEISVSTPLGRDSVSESGEDFVYGAGIGLTVLERLNLRLEYEILDVDELDDADSLWLTAAWRL